jgi:uncharacterized coiled-coil protein SlyX
MNFNKLIKRLQQALSNEKTSTDTSRDRIDALLGELEKKQKKLKQKLEKEKKPKKRKALKLQIKIVSTQLKKGSAFRRKL